eukprot:CAMPEP_0203857082 /NCGR_PEP_ID=MMETSP0359-20131031/10535_1 /ASSEMBLY_ACC=CAM_ASM_000338 /TAXON_ID=268821 /ORGANISM="Scrippsiella Hangoei, Strain SHTV-5" /LENGTH=46 /DNA_ID= /DNA_START= /DNA_END= /DNA_ORIENTATION=
MKELEVAGRFSQLSPRQPEPRYAHVPLRFVLRPSAVCRTRSLEAEA